MDEKYLIIALPLLIGYLLDLIFGDPRSLPHPIRYLELSFIKVMLF